MGIVKEEQNKRASVIKKSWAYLNDNFEKFSDGRKIKIALELAKKDMPTKMEGDGHQTIIVQRINYGKVLNDESPSLRVSTSQMAKRDISEV